MIVAGVDPSLTATGVAVLDTQDRLWAHVDQVGTNGTRSAAWTARWERIEATADTISMIVPGTVELVVIESPSYGQAHPASAHDRAGLWWAIYRRFIARSVTVLPVAPTVRAKYATGAGNSGKDTVMLAAARRYPHIPIETNNHADAVILAAIGARWAGEPIEEALPVAHRDALTKVSL